VAAVAGGIGMTRTKRTRLAALGMALLIGDGIDEY
jgi:hypothetical protein